jgi:hypothetical protein
MKNHAEMNFHKSGSLFALAEHYEGSKRQGAIPSIEKKLVEFKSDLGLIRAALYRSRHNPQATFLLNDNSLNVMSRKEARALADKYVERIGDLELSLMELYNKAERHAGAAGNSSKKSLAVRPGRHSVN